MTEKQKSQIVAGTILVAIDGSTVAQSAAQAAIQIAKSQHLKVCGIYVVDASLVYDTYANYKQELTADIEMYTEGGPMSDLKMQGEETLAWLEEKCHQADVRVSTSLWLGGVSEMILKQSEESDWLALGKRGLIHAKDTQHLGQHFRTIAHQIQQLERPLLVGGEHYRPIKRLLLAYNGSDRSHAALARTSELQRTLGAKVLILAVAENDDMRQAKKWLNEARSRIAEPDIKNYDLLLRSGETETEIVNMATENQVDLIVVGGYSHPAIVEWSVGSTLDQILRSTSLPVLITS